MTMRMREVKNSLARMGFQDGRKTKHDYYFFYHEGTRTDIKTSFSNGSGGNVLGDPLIKNIARQCELSETRFRDFVDRKISEDGYIEILFINGMLPNS